MRDKVISLVKSQGPLLPSQVAKQIGTNILMASAYLAELVSSGIIRISNIKVGGSPLYYAPGQESSLQKFAENLNEKEKRAYEYIREKKIARDAALTPLMRVTLREIKDFAVPLQINYDGRTEQFWKWYLSPNNEIQDLIRAQLELPIAPQSQQNQHEQLNIPKQEANHEHSKLQQAVQAQKDEQHIEPIAQAVQPEKQAPKQSAISEKKSVQKIEQKILPKDDLAEPVPKQKIKKDAFLDLISKFFEKSNINVSESVIIKKNSEIDFIVEIPSPVGNLLYYCKAKNKSRISDSDLSNAYVKGQMRKLPAIYLSPGELSKKAAEMLNSELKGLSFKKI
ncbi:hypothetical protein HYT54_02970 [Candidatus Woesearchaeota archaeon]|nr:hypothetical protein [Candidatus Woesearchaeota archaeon]